MNQIVSNLLVYGNLPEDSILWQLSDICMRLKDGSQDRDVLRTRVFGQVKNPFLYPLIMPLIKTSGRIT